MTRYIHRRNEDGKVLAFYMPKLREAINLTPENEKDFKDCISKAGGSNNNSGVFLHPTKEATVVNSSNGINRRSVSMIPVTRIAKDQLDRFTQGECIVCTFLLTRGVLLNSNRLFCSAVFKPEERPAVYAVAEEEEEGV